jgi:hypothetical protein
VRYSVVLRWFAILGLAALALPALPPSRLAAQDSVIVIDPEATAVDSLQATGLPAEVLNELLATFRDTTALRLNGPVVVPAGTVMSGRVAVYRGEVSVAGTIDGSLTVVNGDLTVRPGGRITGPVLVAGGKYTADPGAEVAGVPRVYWDAAPVTRQSDGTLALREPHRTLGELAQAQASFNYGRLKTTLYLGTNTTYNRSEGLGIVLGPSFEYPASASVFGRLELRAIIRTASDITGSRKDVGWIARTDWRLGRSHPVTVGARYYSLIAGIEDQTLPREEIGWYSVLFERDYRDYYQAQGVAGSLATGVIPHLRFQGSVKYEYQTSVLANDPWALFNNNEPWRPNPLVDDGHYTLVNVGLDFDTRPKGQETPSGWWVRAGYEWGTSGDVAPASLPSVVRPALPTSGYNYSRLTIDARRYNRLSPSIGLNFRLWAGGWIGGDPLPIQRRLSLGGLDMVPGLPFRTMTCAPAGFSDPSQVALCDRLIVTQAEFRHRFDVRLGFHTQSTDSSRPPRFIGLSEVYLVGLADAGIPWLVGNGPGQLPSNRLPVLSEWKADIGAGLDLGGIGFYFAKSVTGPEPVQVFFRLQRRF